MSDDDYGRRRQSDYEYALTGGKKLEGVKLPTAMESILLKAGMPEREVPETASVIVMGINKMGPDAPEKERQNLVSTLMGQCAKDKPDVVAQVTEMAVAKMDKTGGGGLSLQAKAPAQSSFAPPKRSF